MGEVEEFGGVIDEGETEGDEGVDAASDYSVTEELVKHSLSFRFYFTHLTKALFSMAGSFVINGKPR